MIRLPRKLPHRSMFPGHTSRQKRALQYSFLFGISLACTSGICQSAAQAGGPVRSATPSINAPLDARLTQQTPAGDAVKPEDGMQLSLQQAIRMALENNLDIQLEQLDQSVADFSVTRTKGGGTPLQINYNIAETPAGVVIAAMPLLASTGSALSPSGVEPSGIAIPSSYDAGHVLEAQHSLSITATPFSAGTPVPAFDLNLLGQFGWIRRDPGNAIVTSASAAAADTAITSNTLGSSTLVKGFSTGTSIQLGINDFVQSFYSGRSSAVPFTHPNAIALIAQPLLRGAGRANNTRYIASARTNKKISAAILEQQMISTVSGVESLYYDLVSLQNSVNVQEKALKVANDLLSDNRQQLNVGHMPPIEVTRAEALVAASQLALTQARALRDQQENVLRSVLDPQSLTTSNGKLVDIVATDELSSPTDTPQPPIAELIEHALAQRPDIQQSKLQINNGERAVAGSANARLPEIDLYGSFQTLGVISPSLIPVGGDPATGAPVVDTIPTGGVRASRLFEAGIQFNLPVQNRVAQADLGADRAELRKERLRLQQMEAQAAAEVRNAVIALNAAKQAAQSAAASKHLQEQLLSAEVEKFRAGFSTNFAVIQQQSYLAQAETTEIAAQAAWKKAAVQLDRALGNTLQRNGIEVNSDPTKARRVPER
jgi:outer membrane protein